MASHGDRLRGIVEIAMRTPLTPDEADLLCISSLRRVIEAETFVPTMSKIYERVTLETEAGKEEALASKLAVFKV